MSSIILEQVSLLNRIQNSYKVFENEKGNLDVSSCKIRKKSLETIWVKFESNHYSLFNHAEYPNLIKTQPYFLDSLFPQRRLIYPF